MYDCTTHGQESAIESLPYDIDTTPKKLLQYIDVNFNAKKCSTLCIKRPLGVYPYVPLDAQPRRINKDVDLGEFEEHLK